MDSTQFIAISQKLSECSRVLRCRPPIPVDPEEGEKKRQQECRLAQSGIESMSEALPRITSVSCQPKKSASLNIRKLLSAL